MPPEKRLTAHEHELGTLEQCPVLKQHAPFVEATEGARGKPHPARRLHEHRPDHVLQPALMAKW